MAPRPAPDGRRPPLVEVTRPRQALPDPRRRSCSGRSAWSRPSTASPSRSAAARRSGWSASRAAARRPSGGCSCASSSRPPGSIVFDGVELTALKGAALKPYRRRMQIIFQDPYASLDPRTPIGDSIGEGLRIHGLGNAAERREKVRKMMDLVGLAAVPRAALPARVLGRPAPAHRDRPGARPRAGPRSSATSRCRRSTCRSRRRSSTCSSSSSASSA